MSPRIQYSTTVRHLVTHWAASRVHRLMPARMPFIHFLPWMRQVEQLNSVRKTVCREAWGGLAGKWTRPWRWCHLPSLLIQKYTSVQQLHKSSMRADALSTALCQCQIMPFSVSCPYNLRPPPVQTAPTSTHPQPSW